MRNTHTWSGCAIVALLLGAGCGAAAAATDDAKQAREARRQQMIEQCVRNRGTKQDCEQQADTELAAEGRRRHRRCRIPPGRSACGDGRAPTTARIRRRGRRVDRP